MEIEKLIRNSPMRTNYVKSIQKYIDSFDKKCVLNRDRYLNLSENKKRRELKKILGYPLNDKKWQLSLEKKEKVFEDDFYVASKYFFNINGIKVGGILYEKPDRVNDNDSALVFALHGGGGSPEIVGDLYVNSENYNHMVKRLLENRIKVFSPQLLLWNTDIYDSKYDREIINRRLIQMGGSITAFEIKLLMELLTYWQNFCDARRIGVLGLSYGGMYSLYFGALDKRLKAVYSSCWFSNRAKHCWHDWVYFDSENKMFDAEVASLVFPRKLYIEIAQNDEAFPAKDAVDEEKRLRRYVDKNHLTNCFSYKEFEGVHELDKDDKMIEEFKKYLLN